jgi:peptide/nickel transport system permease protein
MAASGAVKRFFDSDIWWSFIHSKVTVVAAIVTFILVFSSAFAGLLSPQNPFDPAQLNLMNAFTPPLWAEGGESRFLLGTDDQGRDLFSAILYGSRLSLMVGFASVALAMVIGITLGIVAGYVGGKTDAIIMRIAEVQLSFPTILVALLIDGVFRSILPPDRNEELALYVLILSIGLSSWVQFARTVRGSTLVEHGKEYVQAARVIGLPSWRIMFRHVLPNVMGPVMVIATINLAVAILSEATLSFLGVGAPPTQPSLGTLIRIGNEFLLSGEWWIALFPGLTLAILVLAVNLLGDWLRDALNPKLR